MSNFSYLSAPLAFAQRYDSHGNKKLTNPSDSRTIFQKDRDKVMYCNAFRRLSGKTQIFSVSQGDHLRTRLTHSLEVSQIARSISAQLGLDVNLTEAIALAHDIGHAPFGHVGERELNEFMNNGNKRVTCVLSDNDKGFKHNLQSMRALVHLSDNWCFSNFLIYGVRSHSKVSWNTPNSCVNFYDQYDEFYSYVDENKNMTPVWSYESFIVCWADEIAQRHHDIEDAYIQKILTLDEIWNYMSKFANHFNREKHVHIQYEKLNANMPHAQTESVISHYISKFVIDTYITELCALIEKYFKSKYEETDEAAQFLDKYLKEDTKRIADDFKFSGSELARADAYLHRELKGTILDSFHVQIADGKSAYVIRCLLKAYMSNPQQLPDDAVCMFVKMNCTQNKMVNDYILSNLPSDQRNVNQLSVHACRTILRDLYASNPTQEALKQNAYILLMRTICDYIAGMTDAYAMKQYHNLYGIRS